MTRGVEPTNHICRLIAEKWANVEEVFAEIYLPRVPALLSLRKEFFISGKAANRRTETKHAAKQTLASLCNKDRPTVTPNVCHSDVSEKRRLGETDPVIA